MEQALCSLWVATISPKYNYQGLHEVPAYCVYHRLAWQFNLVRREGLMGRHIADRTAEDFHKRLRGYTIREFCVLDPVM